MKTSSRQPGQLSPSRQAADIRQKNQDDQRAVTIIEKFPVVLSITECPAGIEEARQAAIRFPKQGKAATALLKKRKRQAVRRSEVYYASIDR
jgi:hypothetical protein